MYLCYEEAVQIGLNAYHRLEYASSCRYAFKIATREFKEYMGKVGFPYSTELAKQRVNGNKRNWNNYKFKSSKKAMDVMADIMEHGNVTRSLKTKIERTSSCTRLSNWSRSLLDNYLVTLSCVYGTPYLTQIKNACSRFFLFLEIAGISKPSEINPNIVRSFFIKG